MNKTPATWHDIEKALNAGNLEEQDRETLERFARVEPPPSANPSFHARFHDAKERIRHRLREIAATEERKRADPRPSSEKTAPAANAESPHTRHSFWSVWLPEEKLLGSVIGNDLLASLESRDGNHFAGESVFVFVAGRGPLQLLAIAKGSLVTWRLNEASGRLVFKFTNFQVPAASIPVSDGWMSEKGPALAGSLGETKCEFRRMAEADVAEATSLIARSRGRQLEPNDEPESSDRSAPRLSDLLSRPLSPRTREIFDAAERFAQRDGGWAALTSAHLLDGLLEMGSGDWKQSTDSTKHAVVNVVRMIERLNPEFLRRRLSGEKKPAAGPNFGRRVAPDTNAIFDFAKELSVRTGYSDGRISVRHLVVAVFALVSHNDRETHAQQILREAGLRPSEVQEEFVTSLANSGPESERKSWREMLHVAAGSKPAKTPDATPSPPDPLRSWLPSFNADLSSGDDKLGISADVAAMASLIVSNSLQPPLSIGLFGNWGSGKSFFMEKLRDRIRALSRSQDADDRRVYWPNVVTVEFNAWHYVDANLWASLVAHLFAELRAWGKPEEGVTAEVLRQKNAALNQLKVATEAREAAQKRLGDAERALEQATNKHDAAVSAVRLNNRVLSLQLARDLWSELKQDETLAKPLADAARSLHQSHLVAADSVESVEELYHQLKELSETGGRLRATGWAMLHGRGRGTALTWLIGGLAVALLLGIKGHWWSFDFGPAAALLTQASAIVIGVAQWVTKSARHVSKLVEPLDDVRRKIERAFKTVSDERDQLVSKFKKEVEASMVQVTTAAQAVTAAEQTLESAKAAVQDATTARMISRFIEVRATSDDYRKHLGIVSTIREDFDRLSKLITAHNEVLLKPSADAVVDGASDLGINRIVLFVDDLDRCPPARVVEVLQAIHLLLAFPLFVVVVGVDSRWVEHSLAVRHPELLKRPRAAKTNGIVKKSVETNGDSQTTPATPSDYLEKIFQIPYRVRRLDESGARSLIDALVVSDRENLPSSTTGRATSEGLQQAASPTPSPQEPKPSTTTPAAATTPNAANVSAAPTPTQRVATPLPKSVAPPPPKILVESLRLTEPEILMMRWLAPWIGRSPRATKRFVNIYRLIKAAVPSAEQRRFIEGGFRIPMVLLAAATRGADVTERFLTESKEPAGWVLTDLVEKLLREQFPEGLPEDAKEAQAKFAHVNQHWPEVEPADDIRRWHRRIAQFSFGE